MSRFRRLLPFLVALGVLAPLAVADAAAANGFGSRMLQQGHSGKDVRTLQGYLTRVGHVTAVDGRFGPGTRRSVRAWETAAQRIVDGRVSRADARALRAAIANPAAGPVPDDLAGATTLSGGSGYTRVERATLNPDGTAVAPASAPQAVKDIIAAGNAIATKPYVYGGGHGRWEDRGYDCSGSVSYALRGARLLTRPLTSSGLEAFGEGGPGAWVTVYANAGHTYVTVAGLRFDTSAAKRQANRSRWTAEARDDTGFVVRHPPGL